MVKPGIWNIPPLEKCLGVNFHLLNLGVGSLQGLRGALSQEEIGRRDLVCCLEFRICSAGIRGPWMRFWIHRGWMCVFEAPRFSVSSEAPKLSEEGKRRCTKYRRIPTGEGRRGGGTSLKVFPPQKKASKQGICRSHFWAKSLPGIHPNFCATVLPHGQKTFWNMFWRCFGQKSGEPQDSATGRPSCRGPSSTRKRQDMHIGKFCPLPLRTDKGISVCSAYCFSFRCLSDWVCDNWVYQIPKHAYPSMTHLATRFSALWRTCSKMSRHGWAFVCRKICCLELWHAAQTPKKRWHGGGPLWVIASHFRVISGPGKLALSHWRPELQSETCPGNGLFTFEIGVVLKQIA